MHVVLEHVGVARWTRIPRKHRHLPQGKGWSQYNLRISDISEDQFPDNDHILILARDQLDSEIHIVERHTWGIGLILPSGIPVSKRNLFREAIEQHIIS